MLNIINHQGNTNQNHKKKSPHICQMATIKKNTNEDVEKREPLYTGNVDINVGGKVH